MKGIQYIIIGLILITIDASPYPTCIQLSEIQRLEEEKTRQIIARQESSIFEEDQFVFNLFDMIAHNPTPMKNMVIDRILFSFKYNLNYGLALILLLVCWFGFDIAKKHSKFIFSLSNYLTKQQKHKAIIVLLCIACFITFTQALKGIDETERIRISLKEIYCRSIAKPKGLIRGLDDTASIGYDAFNQYQKIIDSAVFKNVHSIRPVLQKVLRSAEYIQIAQKIINNLQQNNDTSNFLRQFKQSVSDLTVFYKDDRSGYLFPFIYFHYFIEVYTRSRVLQFQQFQKQVNTKGKQFHLDAILNILSFLCKAFFILVICVSVFIASFLIYNSICKKKIQPKENIVILLQLMLCVFILVCIAAFVVNSFLLAAAGTVYSSVQTTVKSAEVYHKKIIELDEPMGPPQTSYLLLISPFNFTVRNIRNGKYMKYYTSKAQLLAPYALKEPNYFYNMLNESLQYVEDEHFRQQIIGLIQIKDRVVKEPYAAYLKEGHQAFTAMLESHNPDGVFEKVNRGAIGEIMKDFLEISSLLLVNRGYFGHIICGRLSIVLSIILLFVFLYHWQDQQVETINLNLPPSQRNIDKSIELQTLSQAIMDANTKK